MIYYKKRPAPVALGQIIYDDFSSNTIANYTTWGSPGATISGGKLSLSGGVGTFLKGIRFNLAGHSHRYSCLSEFNIVINFKLTSSAAAAASCYIGTYSVNSTSQYDIVGGAALTTAGGGAKAFTTGLKVAASTFSVLNQDGVTRGSVLTTDSCRLTFNRSGLFFTTTFQNFTQGYTSTSTYTMPLDQSLGYYLNNTGQYAIYMTQGSIDVEDFDVSSNAKKYENVLFQGDSIVVGYNSAAFGASTFQYQLLNPVSRTWITTAGGGDKTAEFNLRIPEIIALAPRWVYIMGGVNDKLNGVSEATIIANHATFIASMKNAGIGVAIATPFASDDQNMSTLASSFIAAYPYERIVGIYAATKGAGTGINASYKSDNNHPNATGMGVIASTIASSAPQLKYFKPVV